MDDSTFRSVCIAYGHRPFVANSNQPPFIRFADTSRTAAFYGTYISKRDCIHQPFSQNMALGHSRPSPFQLAEHLVTPCRPGGEDSSAPPQMASRWDPAHPAMTKATYSNITVYAPHDEPCGIAPLATAHRGGYEGAVRIKFPVDSYMCGILLSTLNCDEPLTFPRQLA